MIPQVMQIAQRIKELRDIMDMTEEALASEVGVPLDVYKSYESGETDIPIGKLYLIAGALGVDPTVLLVGDSPRMVDYTVVRGGKGIDVERYAGYKFTSLAYNFIGRQLEPMIVTLEPDARVPDLVTHEGQEFNYVLEGTVAVRIKDNEHILEAGDSIPADGRIIEDSVCVCGYVIKADEAFHYKTRFEQLQEEEVAKINAQSRGLE